MTEGIIDSNSILYIQTNFFPYISMCDWGVTYDPLFIDDNIKYKPVLHYHTININIITYYFEINMEQKYKFKMECFLWDEESENFLFLKKKKI